MGVIDFIFKLWKLLKAKNISTLSASLAYYMMMGFFPTLIVTRAIIDVFYENADVTFFVSHLPEGVAAMIDDYLVHTESFANTGIIAGGVFLSLFSLVKFTRKLKTHFDEINGVKKKMPYLRSWAFSLIVSLYFLSLLYMSLFCLVFGETILKLLAVTIGKEKIFVIIWEKLRLVGVMLLLVLFLYLIFRFLPDKKRKAREIMPGVVFTSLFWTIASYAFSLYIEKFARYSVIYGSLGTVIIFMLWLYILSYIILTGTCISVICSSFSRCCREAEPR